jgi:type II secretory pathway component PulF
MHADDLIALNEEIAGMARAGLPLDQGLSAMAREMSHGRLQRVTEEIAADLRAGHPLPEAIERQGKRLPPFYAGLIEAGIRSGRVGEVLGTLTLYARSIANLRATVVDAALYPAIILILGLILFGFVIGFIMPQYVVIYRDFGMALPHVTNWLLVLSARPLEYFVYPAIALVVGFFLLRFFIRGTERGRCLWARFVYSLPLVGTLIRSARLSAFTELLAILVEHGMPLPRAFHLAGQASTDPLLAAASRRVQQDLGEGIPLGAVLRSHELVPELISWMLAAGEQRGSLQRSLREIAELYRRQVEMRASLMRSVLPPFLVLGTAGILVGLFVFIMLMPMIKLLEGLAR